MSSPYPGDLPSVDIKLDALKGMGVKAGYGGELASPLVPIPKRSLAIPIGGSKTRRYGGRKTRRYGGGKTRRYGGGKTRIYGGMKLRYGGMTRSRYGGGKTRRYGGMTRRYGGMRRRYGGMRRRYGGMKNRYCGGMTRRYGGNNVSKGYVGGNIQDSARYGIDTNINTNHGALSNPTPIVRCNSCRT